MKLSVCFFVCSLGVMCLKMTVSKDETQQHFSLIHCGLDIKTRQELSMLSTIALVHENSDQYKTEMDFLKR